MLSMLGVSTSLLPLKPTWSHPISSERSTTILGRGAVGAAWAKRPNRHNAAAPPAPASSARRESLVIRLVASAIVIGNGCARILFQPLVPVGLMLLHFRQRARVLRITGNVFGFPRIVLHIEQLNNRIRGIADVFVIG